MKSVKCKVSTALEASFVGRKMETGVVSVAEHEGRHACQCWAEVEWSGAGAG